MWQPIVEVKRGTRMTNAPRRKPSFVLVAAWTVGGVLLVLAIGLSPRLLGAGSTEWEQAATTLSAATTLPFAASALLFFSGRRVAGTAIAAVVLLGMAGLSVLVLLSS